MIILKTKRLTDEIAQLQNEILEKKKALAKLRRDLPGELVDNYHFTSSLGEKVTLKDLFQDKDELIVIHNMGVSCNYCTMWADGFNGIYHHLTEKAAFVLSTPDDPEVQEDLAAERSWRFPIVSTRGTTFKKDMGYEKDGKYFPGVSTFRKENNGNIYHHAHTPLGPGDDYCAVWNLFDLLPTGSDHAKVNAKINHKTPYQLTNNIALQVKDYDKAIHFYENTFGMTIESHNENEAKLSFMGTNFYFENKSSEDNHEVFFEFAVDEMKNALEELLANDCKIVKKYHEKSIMMADPYGLNFHLFETKNDGIHK